jgi:hypothetical protein
MHELALVERLAKSYQVHRKLLSKALSSRGIDSSVCKVFLIPFPDIDDLRSAFYKVMCG